MLSLDSKVNKMFFRIIFDGPRFSKNAKFVSSGRNLFIKKDVTSKQDAVNIVLATLTNLKKVFPSATNLFEIIKRLFNNLHLNKMQ